MRTVIGDVSRESVAADASRGGWDSRQVILIQGEGNGRDRHLFGIDFARSDVVVLGPRIVSQRIEALHALWRINLLQSLQDGCLSRFIGTDKDGLGSLHIEDACVAYAPIILNVRGLQLHNVPPPVASTGQTRSRSYSPKRAPLRQSALV